MTRAPRKRTREDPELRRGKILDEAIRIIGKRGYHGFAIQELARRCGLTNAGLLYYFPSKDQLLGSLVQELERREIQALASLVELASGDATPEARSELLRAIVTRGASQPELGRLYAMLQSESLDHAHPAHEAFRQREARTLELFAGLVAAHAQDPMQTARHILALMNGLSLQWLRADGDFDLQDSWMSAIAALVPELVPQRGPPTARSRKSTRQVGKGSTRAGKSAKKKTTNRQ